MERYKIAGSHIAHQEIDGETILVNLKSGAYYSISGTGPLMWKFLSTGHGVEETANAFSNLFTDPSAEMSDSIQSLLRSLVEEGLLTASSDGGAEQISTPTPSEAGTFAAAKIEKFDDLSEALMFDPIHDFDQTTGWPNVKEEIRQ